MLWKVTWMYMIISHTYFFYLHTTVFLSLLTTHIPRGSCSKLQGLTPTVCLSRDDEVISVCKPQLWASCGVVNCLD